MAKKDDYKDKVIGETFEEGSPEKADTWRRKMISRDDMIKYLKSSERYWTLDNDEWAGSEKRKTKA